MGKKNENISKGADLGPVLNGLQKEVSNKPDIFNLDVAGHEVKLRSLISSGKINWVGDDFEEQLRELYAVEHPSIVYSPGFGDSFKKYLSELERQSPREKHGRWVYYPWLTSLVHILEEESFYKVRTARNRNLITEFEQVRFYDSVVGIGGLSVGNSVALAIVLQGGARRIRLADLDRLALSNTNRIRAGVQNLGLLKVDMTARQIYELNPYAEVETMSDGLTPDNIDHFFDGPPKLDIVIDELDNIAVKFLIREHSRKRRLPVIMAADNGDNAVVDVERYDLDQNTPFFHGRMGEGLSYEMLTKLDKFGIGKLITKHVGPENVTERMQQSLLEMGKTIVSWPQLGGAALVNGSAVAYGVRKIANQQPFITNRSLVSLDELLDPDYITDVSIERRKQAAASFRKIFGL